MYKFKILLHDARFLFLKKQKDFILFIHMIQKSKIINLPVKNIFYNLKFNEIAFLKDGYLTVKMIDIFRHHSYLIKWQY